MRILKAAAVAAVTAAFVAVPLAAPASAAGCVTQYIDGRAKYGIDLDAFVYNTAHVNPDGSIWLQPMTPVSLALAIATIEAGQVLELVRCTV